jgi:hypothetical protein
MFNTNNEISIPNITKPKIKKTMKINVFIFLLVFFAGCKKEECEPNVVHSNSTYSPNKKDSIEHVWRLDSFMLQAQNMPDSIILPNSPIRYASFSSETMFTNIVPGLFYVTTPYSVNADSLFVDYSIPFIPTDYYIIQQVTAINLILTYRPPSDTTNHVTVFLTKQN